MAGEDRIAGRVPDVAADGAAALFDPVAAGIAPLLLSALPCVAMCALGLCMRGMGGRSCSADTTAQQMPDSTTTIDRISDVPASDPAAQTNVHLETPQERKHEDA